MNCGSQYWSNENENRESSHESWLWPRSLLGLIVIMFLLPLHSFCAQLIGAPAQLARDLAQLFLLRGAQFTHDLQHHFCVLWKHARDQPPPFRRQMDLNHPAIIHLPFPPHPSVPFQVIHYEGHVAAAAQKLLAQRVLAHRTQMKQRFQMRGSLSHCRIRRAYQVDESAEGPNRL